MSVNFKGYMGDQIGKLGPAVGRKWKGKMVYSSYQGKVHDPNTEAQQLMRARFAKLAKLAATMYQALAIGMKSYAKSSRITEGNAFLKINYSAIQGESADSLQVTYSDLMVSKGTMTGVRFGTPVFTEPSQVQVPIAANHSGTYGTSGQDVVYVALYNEELGTSALSDGTALRGDSSVSVEVPSGWQGTKVYVYGFVVGGDTSNRGNNSDSEYVGMGTIS